MPKRPSSPTRQGESSSSNASPSLKRLAEEDPSNPHAPNTSASSNLDQDGDEGMGEFEDAFEDELEEDGDDGGEVIYHKDSEEEEEEEGEGEEDGMEVDGVKVDGKITRLDEEEEDPSSQPETKVYLPGSSALEEGQVLEPDQSAYEMLHRMNVRWPCLSFDILQDHLGSDRNSFPHEAFFCAGTNAGQGNAKENEFMIMKASSMWGTAKDGELSDSDDESDDGADDDAVLEYRSIPHLGGINRVRVSPTSTPTSSLEPCLDPYPVATWSELGHVSIWDVRPLLNSLSGTNTTGSGIQAKNTKPIYTIEQHRGVEGYALDWAGTSSGGNRASSLRLLSGDIASNIFLTTASQSGFVTNDAPFLSHTSSIEDLQWSPSEQTVFASCSADKSIRIWDVRMKSKKSALTLSDAHPDDINVIDWNRNTDYLLLSGGEEGGLNIWDLRSVRSTSKSSSGSGGPKPVAEFSWHKGPISSVEWNPNEESVFAASGRDDQVSLWDLSVENDQEEDSNAQHENVPDQLLFCHQGATEIKEVHWHKQIPGLLISTSADGFHLFKTISV